MKLSCSTVPLLSAVLAASLVLATACSQEPAPEQTAGAPADGGETSEPAARTPSAASEDDSAAAPERRERSEIEAEFEDALAEAQSTSGDGSPALWTLSDEDTTIHMFGTVHLLRPELDWQSDAFNAAFESADTIVFELDTTSPAAQRAMMTDFLQRGFYQDGRTLNQALSESDKAVVESALEQIDTPFAAINTMEPWMAAINLSIAKLQAEGFDPEAGVDQIILKRAQGAAKELAYLETAADQGDIFDNLDEETQLQFLYETALLLDESVELLDHTVDEWADGDVEGLGALTANPDTGGGDALYDALFVDRNEKWAEQIEAMLDEPGTVFIAVGAGHLAGPDSVVTMLRAEGYEVEGP